MRNRRLLLGVRLRQRGLILWYGGFRGLLRLLLVSYDDALSRRVVSEFLCGRCKNNDLINIRLEGMNGRKSLEYVLFMSAKSSIRSVEEDIDTGK